MSTSTFSQQSPPLSSSTEPAPSQRRIKLTIKPLKFKAAAPVSSIDTPANDAPSPAPSSSHARNPITLRIKPPRSNSVAESQLASSRDEEKKILPKLILKPPRSVPPPIDINTLEVDDVTAREVSVEDQPEEGPPVEILAPPSPPVFPGPSRAPLPGKVKIPRPIKLKPLKEVLRRLITQIKKKDDYAFFLVPVDTSQIPGYPDVIKDPMDFGTMTEKNEKGQYRSLEQFKDDFLLVTSNAKTFNPPPSIYYSEASKIENWGLDQIAKASAQVIEYEADWTIDVVADEGATAVTANNVDNVGADSSVTLGDMPAKTRSPSVMSSAVGTPNLPAERSKRSRKKVPIVTESWEEYVHLPGSKDGIGAFPPCSELAALITELKLRGKRFRTKKERLKREKEGPPFATDGSLDYTEMENPFTVLRQLLPNPLNVPQVIPLIPTQSASAEAATDNRASSQPPEEKRETRVDGPVALPLEALPAFLSDPHRYTFVNPPVCTSVVGTKQLRHWTITRNPPRTTRTRDEDEEAMLIGPQAKRRRVGHSDYGTFASLLGTIAAESDLKADDFEEVFGGEAQILDQLRQSIQSREPTTKATELAGSEVEDCERLVDANEYIRDLAYGGVDGLAYFRSLAEFVGEYHGPLKEESDNSSRSGELGMPLAQWVAQDIVNPLTLGNHSTLRAVAGTLARARAQEKDDSNGHASHAIQRYLSLASEDKSPNIEKLRELKAIAEPSARIDMALLLRQPEELFLAENEWANLEHRQSLRAASDGAATLDPIPAATIPRPRVDAGAIPGLGLASVLPGQTRPPGALAGDSDGAIEHALNATAEHLRDLGRRVSEQGLDMKPEEHGGQELGQGETEDSVMRQTRLLLIALAKRAPIDRIALMPPELVPVHIRHIVPTLGT